MILKKRLSTQQQKTILILPDSLNDDTPCGDIVSVGDKCKNYKSGDCVVFNEEDTMIINVKGIGELSVVKEDKILGFIND